MVFSFIKASYNSFLKAFSKAGAHLGTALRTLFKEKLDDKKVEQLEKLLYEADLGISTVDTLIAALQKAYLKNPALDGEALLELIRQDLLASFVTGGRQLKRPESGPAVYLIVGVNGNGKTTSVARLAYLFKEQGHKVLLGAADTFRAAAIEQLETWAQRLDVEIVKGKSGGDPAAIAFDTIEAGKARSADIILIDTAGRLHTKQHLMKELEKVKRSCSKALDLAPHETLLVLDATTGQNAIDQARTFHASTPITGLILTKLDGTAKGGIVVNIEKQLKIPVKFIGTGETKEDLYPFDPQTFIAALLDN